MKEVLSKYEMRKFINIVEGKMARVLAPRLLIIVHPGSACGSADFNLGEDQAAEERSHLVADIEGWSGPVLVVADAYTRELSRYPALKNAIAAKLTRSVKGDAWHKDWVRTAVAAAQRIVAPGGTVAITGAWVGPEGCCNAMRDALVADGFDAEILPSAMRSDLQETDVMEASSAVRFLYHGTSSIYLKDILTNGLEPPSYWGTEEVAIHFGRMKAKEDGGNPILITMPMRFFHKSDILPDENIMDFPIDFKDDIAQEHRIKAWNRTKKDWQACLRIFGAVVYMGSMHVEQYQVQAVR